MNSCKIYIVSHKEFSIPLDNLYIPLQVGMRENLFPEGCRDNVGDNIAEKNANYCELTALYWIWKNVSDIKNVGICHYRRFFSKNMCNNNQKNYLDEETIVTTLDKYDIIVPQKLNINGCVKSFYYIQGEGKEKDIDNMADIICREYPNYKESLFSVFNDKSAFYCNMMITSKAIFDEYCEWLFSILFELEKQTDLTGYTSSEARIYGYLSEILLNVWVRKNGLKVKYFPVINTEHSFQKRIKGEMKNFLLGIYNNFEIKSNNL